MTPQVADVAFKIGIAPDADESVHAVLIDDARVGLGKRLRAELHAVQHREVLEALGAEQADAPARRKCNRAGRPPGPSRRRTAYP